VFFSLVIFLQAVRPARGSTMEPPQQRNKSSTSAISLHQGRRPELRHAKPQPIRTKIDLADPSQIRILRRRLGISAGDLQRVVERVGNSIAAVCKEIEPRKAPPVTEPMPVQIESPPPQEVGVAVSAA
jgi:hypothetical protein